MARIVQFKEVDASGRARQHTEVDCGYSVITVDGVTLLQLDTYGSSQREIPGKVSQSIQLDKQAGSRLIALVREAFPDLS